MSKQKAEPKTDAKPRAVQLIRNVGQHRYGQTFSAERAEELGFTEEDVQPYERAEVGPNRIAEAR